MWVTQVQAQGAQTGYSYTNLTLSTALGRFAEMSYGMPDNATHASFIVSKTGAGFVLLALGNGTGTMDAVLIKNTGTAVQIKDCTLVNTTGTFTLSNCVEVQDWALAAANSYTVTSGQSTGMMAEFKRPIAKNAADTNDKAISIGMNTFFFTYSSTSDFSNISSEAGTYGTVNLCFSHDSSCNPPKPSDAGSSAATSNTTTNTTTTTSHAMLVIVSMAMTVVLLAFV